MQVHQETDVIYTGQLHKIIFLGPCVMTFVALFLYTLSWQLGYLPDALLLVSAAWWVITWFVYYFSSLSIKKNRVIIRSGFFIRQTLDIPMAKIESIDIRQTILGSVLQYGDLLIVGTGGTRNGMARIREPLTCRRHIEQLMHP